MNDYACAKEVQNYHDQPDIPCLGYECFSYISEEKIQIKKSTMNRNVYPVALAFIILGSFISFRLADHDLAVVFARINEEVLQHGRAYQTLGEATNAIGHR